MKYLMIIIFMSVPTYAAPGQNLSDTEKAFSAIARQANNIAKKLLRADTLFKNIESEGIILSQQNKNKFISRYSQAVARLKADVAKLPDTVVAQ